MNYDNNGVKKNVTELCVKVDNIIKEMKEIKDQLRDHRKWSNDAVNRIIEKVASTKTRANINTGIIIVILVALLGLGAKIL